MDGDGRIWIVQARPITVAASCPRRAAVVRGVRQVAWSNANVNENFPEPISPLLYSIARTGYYHYFRNLGRAFGFSRRRLAAMEDPLRQIIGVQGARMYYNLTSIHGVLRSAPFGDQLASWFNQFTGAEETAAPARPTGSAAARAGSSRSPGSSRSSCCGRSGSTRSSRGASSDSSGRSTRSPRGPVRLVSKAARGKRFSTTFARFATFATTAGRTPLSPTRPRWCPMAR